MNTCYFTGQDCDCGGFDVVGDCPYDDYVHDPDNEIEDMIEQEYFLQNHGAHDDETGRF